MRFNLDRKLAQNENVSLEAFVRLSRQTGQFGWSITSEKEVVRDLLITNMQFKEIPREL